jgi:hypothetical protein
MLKALKLTHMRIRGNDKGAMKKLPDPANIYPKFWVVSLYYRRLIKLAHRFMTTAIIVTDFRQPGLHLHHNGGNCP